MLWVSACAVNHNDRLSCWQRSIRISASSSGNLFVLYSFREYYFLCGILIDDQSQVLRSLEWIKRKQVERKTQNDIRNSVQICCDGFKRNWNKKKFRPQKTRIALANRFRRIKCIGICVCVCVWMLFSTDKVIDNDAHGLGSFTLHWGNIRMTTQRW